MEGDRFNGIFKTIMISTLLLYPIAFERCNGIVIFGVNQLDNHTHDCHLFDHLQVLLGCLKIIKNIFNHITNIHLYNTYIMGLLIKGTTLIMHLFQWKYF